ncbi:hypothetical protein Leryth_007503 [Lithospermum erythrorhizon]|nr:hypothetical protein Leryth_007503 [Lithospermum erythrorhizon]
MFSVGQSLRIKVGPLKGYLCRVLAIRRSDVTVKLDSQHKILTGLTIPLFCVHQCMYMLVYNFMLILISVHSQKRPSL